MGSTTIPVTQPHGNPRRAHIEALIERAIEYLDRIDGDPDLEEDEPDQEHDGAEQQENQVPHYGIDQTVQMGVPEWLRRAPTN